MWHVWERGEVNYRILMRKPEGKRKLERPRSRQEDNIKMRVQDVRWGFGWTGLVLDRDKWKTFVNVVMNLLIL
jgi:hypothetical protein